MDALLAILAVAVWLTPAGIALHRKQGNAATTIVLIDVFLSWTLVGWIVALAYACNSSNLRPRDVAE